jgi:hypothetical protein
MHLDNNINEKALIALTAGVNNSVDAQETAKKAFLKPEVNRIIGICQGCIQRAIVNANDKDDLPRALQEEISSVQRISSGLERMEKTISTIVLSILTDFKTNYKKYLILAD